MARRGRARGRPFPRRVMRIVSITGMKRGESPCWPGLASRAAGRYLRQRPGEFWCSARYASGPGPPGPRHLAGPAGPRILFSRSEASVEEHPWARQDSRNVTGRRWSIYGAGRVRCVAARYVPARSGVPRYGLPPRRFPCPPSGARHARANGRARERRRGRAGGRRSGVGAVSLLLLVAGLAAYALTQLIEAVFRPSHATGTMGRWRQRAVSSWGCLLYSVFCLSTARLLAGTPPKQTAESEQRQDTDVTAVLLRTGWGRVLLVLAGVLAVVAGVEIGRRSVRLGFRARFTAEHMPRALAMLTRALGGFGCVARAVVFVLAGAFVLKAAVLSSAKQTKGLDAIFRSVAGSAGGSWLLALLASGLLCYGLYRLIEARYRDLTPGR